ncbi:tRNA glutamyl-Q(34) synthetase GluQRS [Mesorhizobium sp. NBSH29]|uniref:tRNA glutamyl-Q(34) synthetase GluQRS n=1 Tax=Mesorhizobium sp. NBSH29 TaxID=2654249 RepID=UPI0018966C53|nr:tRNA glutamyl-Q(34) synthetase GluQRS [Mesorhizobium sp. NBSH29]QPC85631.1 tRNA glutamyl-Q(34) synthetase GluQRS [Mesorhizobium sp. NBSH29]
MTLLTFRFAPSPNGELHLGHAQSALLNHDMARRVGGRFLLRIEDIDTSRCTPEFEAGIYRDLEWLGIEWETPVRRQSEHFADYEAALARLIKAGFVYPAFMTRGQIRGFLAERTIAGDLWPRDPDGAPLYPGLDKKLSERGRLKRIASGESFVWRLDVEKACGALPAEELSWQEAEDGSWEARRTILAEPRLLGDVVIARKEIPTSYFLSVVVDDALQGVSHIVRGRDLYQATAIQRLLQQHLGLPAPLYFHHRLIEGPDGRKLSKSNRDSGIRALREAGVTPADVRRMVGLE